MNEASFLAHRYKISLSRGGCPGRQDLLERKWWGVGEGCTEIKMAGRKEVSGSNVLPQMSAKQSNLVTPSEKILSC